MSTTTETIDALKKAHGEPVGDGELAKAGFTTALGLVNYDLQAPAKLIVPLYTPLRNEIPRVPGNGGTATNWKIYTADNSLGVLPGVSEGNRGGVITPTLTDKAATYIGQGLENSVSFEADYAAKGFDDAKAKAVEGTLRAVMVGEERMLLGGNASLALGTTATPAGTGATAGGSVAAATYKVQCVYLSFDGYMAATATGIKLEYTRTNADGSTDTIPGGAAQISAESADVIVGGSGAGKITATVAAKAGAFAYAWYVGLTTATKFHSVTLINSVEITALPASGNQAASTLPADDKSVTTLAYDGLITSAIKLGGYTYAMPTGTAGVGTKLTSDGASGILEFETALATIWRSNKVTPDTIWASANTIQSINKIIIANGGASIFRLTTDAAGGSAEVINSVVVPMYLNKITGTKLRIRVHPDMPDGTILFACKEVPSKYVYTNIGAPAELKVRRDYHQIDWPLRSRKYEYGVYVDSVLAMYFPGVYGVIYNVAV